MVLEGVSRSCITSRGVEIRSHTALAGVVEVRKLYPYVHNYCDIDSFRRGPEYEAENDQHRSESHVRTRGYRPDASLDLGASA